MALGIEGIALLLFVAAVVAIVARRLGIPYTVGLVLAGIGLAALRLKPDLVLTKELLFSVFLPPLIFEAAFYIRWHELRRELPLIVVLATVGIALAGAVTAAGMRLFVGWSWPSAALFGILIAATDPVSIIATFKEAGVHGRLRLLVEAESLFNDGAAAVAFAMVLAIAAGGQVGAAGLAQALGVTILGGLLCGVLVSGAALLLAGRNEDHLVEITLTAVAAYGSFLLAEHLHASGVLATLAAGLVIGNVGSLGAMTDMGRDAVESFWEVAAFVVNSLIFLLMGLYTADQPLSNLWWPIAVAIGLVFVGRALAVYPLCALFSLTPLRVTPNHQHALFWGGFRGALGLALALSLPPELADREVIVTVAFGVVAFSVIVQGLTMVPLLRRFGEIP